MRYEALLPMLKEKDFQGQILQLAKLFGWLYYHTHDSRHSAAGFPDLVLCRPPRLIFAELKTETGSVSPAQKRWLEDIDLCRIQGCGLEVYLWRAADLETIVGKLR